MEAAERVTSSLCCTACRHEFTSKQSSAKFVSAMRAHRTTGKCDRNREADEAEAKLIDSIHARWPSTTWGEREWQAVFGIDPGMADAMLDDMFIKAQEGRNIDHQKWRGHLRGR